MLFRSGLLRDIVATSQPLLAAIPSPNQPRTTLTPSVALSATIEVQLQELERLLSDRVYHHPEVARMDAEGQAMIHSLFNAYRRDPTALPARFASRITEQSAERVICDYIAGMTDRFCMAEHDKLTRAQPRGCSPTPTTPDQRRP